MFRESPYMKLSYNQQGLIYFICKDYKNQPEYIQKKILNLCTSIGKDNYQALFELLTTDKSATKIAMQHYMSSVTLYRLRVGFFKKWKETN